ncbi:MAG: hypothetical protein JW828_14725 [Sedimentisphaerales bacterium]|nr:hypothetical protein [Sedimentisphaerales bacterium]
MKNHVNRRRFLRGTIFSGLGLIVLPNLRSVLRYPANDRGNVATLSFRQPQFAPEKRFFVKNH